jgi:hypothetical protein
VRRQILIEIQTALVLAPRVDPILGVNCVAKSARGCLELLWESCGVLTD